MSAEKALEFMNTVCRSEELQAEIEALVKGKSPSDATKAVARFAGGRGFTFSADEASAVRSALRQRLVENDVLEADLSDRELEAVAGGGSLPKPGGMEVDASEVYETIKRRGQRRLSLSTGNDRSSQPRLGRQGSPNDTVGPTAPSWMQGWVL